MKILSPIIANRNIMCPFDFYGLEHDSYITAHYDGRDLIVKIMICPWCDRKYTTLKYFDDLKTIHIKGESYINLNLPEYRMRRMVELNEKGKPVEKREKSIEEKIIDILTERQPLYPKHIARYIKEDTDTVKDYLYNKLGDAVYRDSEYYWWINDSNETTFTSLTQLYGFPFELIPTDYETSIAAPLSPQSSTEAYYTLGGTRIASPKRGITIVRTSDGKAKKIFTR